MSVWMQTAGFYLSLMVGRILPRLGVVGRRLVAWQSGQSMVEYAIVAALVAIVAMAAVQGLGTGVAGVFQRILGRISGIGG